MISLIQKHLELEPSEILKFLRKGEITIYPDGLTPIPLTPYEHEAQLPDEQDFWEYFIFSAKLLADESLKGYYIEVGREEGFWA